MHLPGSGTCLPCHQKPTTTHPVVATALHLTGKESEWNYVASLLWTRKRTGLYLAHPGQHRLTGVSHVSLHALPICLAKKSVTTESLQHPLWYQVSVPAHLSSPARTV